MPGIDGWEVTAELKRNAKTKHIPIVALTAHALQTERQRTERAGCDGFLAKPCAPPDLLAEDLAPAGAATRAHPRPLHADHVAIRLSSGVTRSTGLVEVLDRILDKGLFVGGDIKISLAEVELLTIRIRLIVCSLDKAREIGLDWWMYDRHLVAGTRGRERRPGSAHRRARAPVARATGRRAPVTPVARRGRTAARARKTRARP